LIAVVQRVSKASVTVAAEDYHAAIGPGLCVLLGVEDGDTEAEADWIAKKLVQLRIFSDDNGQMNNSVQDIGGELLVVSQFTLAGDCRKGNRPSFVRAAPPEEGRRLYERVCDQIGTLHRPVQTGRFGAMMEVALVNDGPVTIIVDRKPQPARA
jgi:D-tyrosyl-tRNA(Tyr) deacylase